MSHRPRSPRSLPSRPVVRILGVSTLLVAVLGGCGSSAESQTESVTESAGAVDRVEVRADTGSVELRRGPDGSAQVARTLRWGGDERPEFTQSVSGTTLTITARCPDGDDECRTDMVVTVPAATSSRVEVTTGEIAVDGVTGAQDLLTSTGTVRGTGLGAVPVTARSSTGEVSLGFAAAPPSVDAEVETGNAEVRVPVGPVYEVRAQVQTGNSRVEVADTPGADHRISVRAGTGNVTVTNG